MTEIRGLAIVIPARNEAGLIDRCLRSLARSIEECRDELQISVTVVADGCTDDTVAIAGTFDFATVISTPPVGVGAARQLGAAHAIRDLGLPPEQVWLANSDADSAVEPDWVANHVRAAAAGADIRIGAVKPDFADLSPRQIRAWTRTHSGGAARGHIHGANLGIRASTYLAVSGFRPLFLHEDKDLVARATEIGAVVAIEELPDVVTSGRSVGRAPGGYATYIATELIAAAARS